MQNLFLFSLLAVFFISCEEESESVYKLKFQFEFDETQIRLDNIGEPATIPAGNAAQTPTMQTMSAHYIELLNNKWVQYGAGEVVYRGTETNAGGAAAINFDEASITGEGELFREFSIKDITPGTYQYIRVSVSYQNGQVVYDLNNVQSVGDLENQSGTLASFLGYNNYVSTIQIDELDLAVNDDRLQGFWAFETDFDGAWEPYNAVYSGQAPAGATTVVNPLATSSSIPAGSCVITGEFDPPLVITGDETEDITVILSFSTNNSFEWEDYNGDGTWDIDAQDSANDEPAVDMGLRGLIPRVQ